MINADVLSLNVYHWSWWSLPPLVSGLFMLMLGVFIIAKNMHSLACWSYFITSLATSIWLLSYAACYSAITPEAGLFWSRNAYIGIYYLAISFYFFTIEITEQ
ncbi:MAG: histidine kinase N-terminal 7TM domain-containing protein, partial [Kiritimatiellae bacterium]|nr:histidine kinase N-terminal 7TM domain-containing protein [Kiritimatiellia bacterium]